MDAHSTNAAQVTDPSDFAATPLAPLGALDALLRCQICKDHHANAVITSCAHTFCSLCIRRCLSVDGRCPTCRAPEQESKLRRNVALQEAVDAFCAARGAVLEVAQRAAAQAQSAAAGLSGRVGKRRRHAADADGDEADTDDRVRHAKAPRTRSQHKAHNNVRGAQLDGSGGSQGAGSAGSVMVIDDSDETASASFESTPAEATRTLGDGDGDGDAQMHDDGGGGGQRDDGLVPCPICGTRMKHEVVYEHLDSCDGTRKAPQQQQQQPHPTSAPPKSSVAASSSRRASSTPQNTGPPPERLPQLNYSLFKEAALRKKLQELGIPNWGGKALLVRRHTEWINLWNANCDAARPLSRRDLLAELDAWERSQGGHARNGGEAGIFAGPAGNAGSNGAGVMRKDFDGEAWARNNKDDFDDLIARARKGRNKAIEPEAEQGSAQAESSTQANPAVSRTDASISAVASNIEQNVDLNASRKSPPQTPILPQPETPLPGSEQSPQSRRATSPVPGFTSSAQRRTSIDSKPRPIPTLRKSSLSLPDRILASMGGKGDADGAVEEPATRKKPMFEVPGEPIEDVDVGSAR